MAGLDVYQPPPWSNRPTIDIDSLISMNEVRGTGPVNLSWHENRPYHEGKPLLYRKLTFDTGAAVTALAESFAPNYTRSRPSGVQYKTAPGELITDQGSQVPKGCDRHGNMTALRGRVASVHKSLLSAVQICKAGHDTWLGEDGGWMWNRDSYIGQKMRQ